MCQWKKNYYKFDFKQHKLKIQSVLKNEKCFIRWREQHTKISNFNALEYKFSVYKHKMRSFK